MIVKNNQWRFFFLIEIKEQNLLRRKNNKQKLISVLIVKFTFTYKG